MNARAPRRSLIAGAARGALLLLGAGTAAHAGAAAGASDELRVRALPLQRQGERAIAWLEVTGNDAERVDSGAERARLLVDGKEIAPHRGLVQRIENSEPFIQLDSLRARRRPGAVYVRLEFAAVPPPGSQSPRLSWTWHKKEARAPLQWDGVRVGTAPSPGERAGHGLRVSIPSSGWQRSGLIRPEGSALSAAADETAWFHLLVKPGPNAGGRFPSGYVGYEVRFRAPDGRLLPLRSATSSGTVGGRQDSQEILAQFEAAPAATGTLEWAPVFSVNTGREYRLGFPERLPED